MTFSFQSAFYAALTSFMACGFILATRRWHNHLSMDTHYGVQKFHVDPTPRIGGLGCLVGITVGWSIHESVPLFANADRLLGLMLLASLPAFLFGLAEDLTKHVSVRNRLLATMASGFCASWLTGYDLNRLDVPGLDVLLVLTPVALLFTVFAVAGVANAYNIIDGFNGLSSAAMIVALAAIAATAYKEGDAELVYVALVVMGGVSGFLAWNYPLGRLFLGDGGAYALGFLIAWLAVMLPARNPAVSPWASLMACGYPVMETVYTMLRRTLNKRSTSAPDALHLHSLVKTVVISKYMQHLGLVFRNSLVLITLFPFMSSVALIGVVFHRQTNILIVAFVLLFGVYALMHQQLVRVRHAQQEAIFGQRGRESIDCKNRQVCSKYKDGCDE